MKIVVGVKKIIEIKNIISQDHSFLNFRKLYPFFFLHATNRFIFSVFNVIERQNIKKPNQTRGKRNVDKRPLTKGDLGIALLAVSFPLLYLHKYFYCEIYVKVVCLG